MKMEQIHINQIRVMFAEMNSKDDFLELLNEAGFFLFGENFNPFKMKQLNYYANPDLCRKRYTSFGIRKKSGGQREINAPVKVLKSILRVLNFVLQCVSEPHSAATGFIINKSIVDNARIHICSNYVYNLDLKDFFHSFDRNRVKMGLFSEPFNLKGERIHLAFFIACLCTHPIPIKDETKIVLPQGSPTSPTLTNILCRNLDRKLTGLAKRFEAKYSRYADDITFSSHHNCFKREDFLKELERIITEDNLIKSNNGKIEIGPQLGINPDKTRLQKKVYRQEVTGLIVNNKVNVNQRYLKQIRMWLYYWEIYGYEKASKIFSKDYRIDKGHVKNGNSALMRVLDGKLEFLKMVKGSEDSTYMSLRHRFLSLTEKKERIQIEKIGFDDVLNTLFSKGLNPAMDLYDRFKKG